MEGFIKNISSSSQASKAPVRKIGGGGSNPSLSSFNSSSRSRAVRHQSARLKTHGSNPVGSSNGDVVQRSEYESLKLCDVGSNPIIASNGGLSTGHSFTTERFNPLSPTN